MKIPTPYVREPRNPDLSRVQITRESTNYSDYDIFVLPINLYPFVRKDLIISLEEGNLNQGEKEINGEKEEDYATRYYVVITDEYGEEPNLAEEEVEDIKESVEMVCADNSYLVFVCSYDNKFYSEDDEPIPASWTNAMIPYLPFHQSRQAIQGEAGIYIFIDPSEDYERIYNYYQDFFIQWISSKYTRGVIPSTFTEKFVKDWHLERDSGFFRPRAKNPMVMGNDVIEFFQHKVKPYEGNYRGNQVNKKEKRFYVWTTPDYSSREKKIFSIILLTNNYKFVVDQSRFHIVVSGYTEAKSLCQALLQKISWNQEEQNEMENTDVKVPYENPYVPYILH